jgi:hypothetical protein
MLGDHGDQGRAYVPSMLRAPQGDEIDSTTSGGVNARTGGKASFQRAISTMVEPLDGPWLNFEVPRSWVSILALPWAQIVPSASPAGSYQAPQESLATPGSIASDSTAPARQNRTQSKRGRLAGGIGGFERTMTGCNARLRSCRFGGSYQSGNETAR